MSSKYFIRKDELVNTRYSLKLKKCDHCGITGMIIMHGFIYLYDE